MATVKHPATGDEFTVPDADLGDWLGQGWLDAAPRRAEQSADDKAREASAPRASKAPRATT